MRSRPLTSYNFFLFFCCVMVSSIKFVTPYLDKILEKSIPLTTILYGVSRHWFYRRPGRHGTHKDTWSLPVQLTMSGFLPEKIEK